MASENSTYLWSFASMYPAAARCVEEHIPDDGLDPVGVTTLRQHLRDSHKVSDGLVSAFLDEIVGDRFKPEKIREE